MKRKIEIEVYQNGTRIRQFRNVLDWEFNSTRIDGLVTNTGFLVVKTGTDVIKVRVGADTTFVVEEPK